MKKNAVMLLMLLLTLTIALCGCGPDTGDPQVQRTEGTEAEDAYVQNENTQQSLIQEIDLDSFVCMDQIISASDITMTQSDGAITLTEDGMTVELSTESALAYRKGFVTAVMKLPPQIVDGKVYVSTDFYNDFLCKNESEQPSLFHGTLFYADEVLAALEQPERSAFSQKLLNELLLPASMGIETPHIDLGRVFMVTRLSELSETMTKELVALGYADAAEFTYSEYLILSGAQTLEQAEMGFVLESYAELSEKKADEMTVAEFTLWESGYTRQQFLDGLSEEERDFAGEKKIELIDLSHLKRSYYGAYMEQSDEDLKAALEDYYATDINYLREMVDSVE